MNIWRSFVTWLAGGILRPQNWPLLLEKINSGDSEAVYTAHAHWEERPDTFVSSLTSAGVDKLVSTVSAHEVLPTLTSEEVRQIGKDTCMAFVGEHLELLPHLEVLSAECRDLIY